MYACTRETGCGFFEGVCALSSQTCISSDHPTPFVDRFMPLLSLFNQVSASYRSE
jgi:hypothetical protein